MLIQLTIAGLLSTLAFLSVLAQSDISQLPPCAATCLGAQTQARNCSTVPNSSCICPVESLILNCIQTGCPSSVAETAAGILANFCIGLVIAPSSVPSTNTTNTNTTTSTSSTSSNTTTSSTTSTSLSSSSITDPPLTTSEPPLQTVIVFSTQYAPPLSSSLTLSNTASSSTFDITTTHHYTLFIISLVLSSVGIIMI